MVCPTGHSGRVGNGETTPFEHHVHHELEGLPLGPDSLLWKYFDNRMALVPATGIKQLMMLDIDAGVDQHSAFFDEIVERTFRSMVQIGGAVYDLEKGTEMGRSIRDQHRDIKGINSAGDRYHALNPKLWADTHITFADGVYEVADRFDSHELTDDEREILWMEMITWYQQYGVSDRYLPADYAAYKERSDEMAREYVLTDTAKRALNYAVKGSIPRPNAVPAAFWKVVGLPMMPTSEFLGKVVISGLPEEVRKEYRNEIPYSKFDKLRIGMFEAAVRRINWDKVAGRIRYPDAAYQAFKRAGRYDSPADQALDFASDVVMGTFNKAKALSPIKF